MLYAFVLVGMRRIIIFLSAIVLFTALVANAATNIVNISTVAELKSASTSAKDGTRIELADGVYDISALTPDASGTYLAFSQPVTIASKSGDAEKCVIIGGGTEQVGRAFSFSGGAAYIEGVTVSNFTVNGSCGAILAKNYVTVRKCRFIGCHAENGAGGVSARITAVDSIFDDCTCKGAGGAGGGATVSHGKLVDCTIRRCSGTGYGVVRNGGATRCRFEDCDDVVGYMEHFEDCMFTRCGPIVNSTLDNCGIFDGHYAETGVQNLLSLCIATNCSITGTTGGNPKQWNSGIVSGGELVNCVVAGNRSVRDVVKFPAYQAEKETRLVETVVTNGAYSVAGKGFDPGAGARKRKAEEVALAEKLATEAKSGVHEIMRIDFDNDKPRSDGGAYGGFHSGVWGDSKCEYTLVPGEGGKGQAMRVNLKGMVGGQLQVFSQPWTMWQGSWYRLRFKARGVDHPGTVSVGVRKYGYPWSMLAWPFKTFHPENEWKEYSIVKKSQHDVSGGFGIMIGLGDVGCVEFDDFVVEKLDFDPMLTMQVNTNPKVYGNLVPRPSFETRDDNFFILNRQSNSIWGTWLEPWMERCEDAHSGRYSLHFPPPPERPKEDPGYKLSYSRTLESIDIPVASGCRYKLSCWYKTVAKDGGRPVAYCQFGARSGKTWLLGKRFFINQPGWQKLEIESDKPVPANISNVNISIEINGYDIYLDDIDFSIVEDGEVVPAVAEKPYELELVFAKGDPRMDPKIVRWDEKLPLEIAAMSSDVDKAGEVPARLRVTSYPDVVTFDETYMLEVGKVKKLEIDPGANGILRIELLPVNDEDAVPLEKVMARLPKPRKLGTESYFGTHLSPSPYFINYGAAIGMKWQRLHDCSNMCKMKWANPEAGRFQWTDEIVDYFRSMDINILALPDYPAQYIMPTNAEGKVVYDCEGYRAWCRELAKHYKGKIEHFEIWNEPYMPYFFKGDSKEFGKIFNAGAEGIREGNPDAKVIGWCTEFTTPKYVTTFLKDYPLEKKPDYNSVHYYYTSVPGDGELSYDRIINNIKETFGEYAGEEIWNTEGNLGLDHTFYSRMRKFDRSSCDRGVAFGTRGWAETISCGITKTFLYTTHNTDNPHVGGLMTLIDYDRSVTPEAAATAVTAYFIDGLKPVKTNVKIDGVKFRVFVGDGRTVALVWDDVIKEGRLKLDTSRFDAVYDAMGNRVDGSPELTMVPIFVTLDREDASGLVKAVEFSIGVQHL